MTTIKAQSPILPIEVEIGDTVVKGRINMAISRRKVLGDTTLSESRKIAEIEKAEASAVEANDLDAIDRYEDEKAEHVGHIIKTALGERFYNEVLLACGQGEPAEPGVCNEVMYQIMYGITEALAERNGSNTINQAARSLNGVSDALQTHEN